MVAKQSRLFCYGQLDARDELDEVHVHRSVGC